MPPPSPTRSVTQVMSMPCSVLLLDALRNRFLAIILILILLHPSPGSSIASLEPLPLTQLSRSARSRLIELNTKGARLLSRPA
jgi:hypothetical protein